MADDFIIEDDDGNEIELPSCWAICGTCRGNGTLALHGETYMNGGYDTACDDCGGSGKLKVVDEDALSLELRAAWETWRRELAESRACEAAERRMGA